MQWVVTTGRSVEDARARALDVLGIHEDDLECEVLAEPTSSLFGLRTTEARVRARVKPTRPRPKVDRRNRRTKRDGKRRKGGRSKRSGNGDQGRQNQGPANQGRPKASASNQDRDDAPSVESPADVAPRDERATTRPRPAQAPAAAPTPAPSETTTTADEAASTPSDTPKQARPRGSRGAPMSDIPLTEQEPTAVDFVTGLVEAFGATATVESEHLADDDAIEIRVEGDDLGLLVGQRGNTLASISELTRTAVAQQHSGRLEGRLRVDVAGYRARRKEALERFVAQVADKVLDSGSAVALEPMSPPDRKIVHDAANEIDGVHTSSRGEDRRRHVVIHPDA